MITGVIETFAICRLYYIGYFLKKVVARLTEHDDVIKHCSEESCIGPAPAWAGPERTFSTLQKLNEANRYFCSVVIITEEDLFACAKESRRDCFIANILAQGFNAYPRLLLLLV